jgi:hypothetical protein
MIRFGRTTLVSICLDLIEHRSSVFVNFLGIVVDSASSPPCGFWRIDDQQLEV